MKNLTTLCTTALLTGIVCTGCAKDSKSDDTPAKTTQTTAAPTTKPAAAASATAAVPDKDMTHVLTKDEPFYATSPAQARQPDGTLKAGTKVVVLMPRGSYSQVMTADGKRVYTSTAALKPVGG